MATRRRAGTARTSAVSSCRRDSPIRAPKDLGGQEGRGQHPEEHRRHHGARSRSARTAATPRKSSSSRCPSPTCPPRSTGEKSTPPGSSSRHWRSRRPGRRVVAWNFVDAAPDLTVAVYFTSEKLAKENPELVRKFTEAINESLAYANAPTGRGAQRPQDVHRHRPGDPRRDDPAAVAGRDQPGVRRDAGAGSARLTGIFGKAPDLDQLFGPSQTPRRPAIDGP